MNNSLINVGDEIFRELDEPSDLSSAIVAAWLKFNVGKLNNQIDGSYTVTDETMEISPPLGINEKDIFKMLYNCYYYEKKFRATIGALSTDSVIEVESDGAKVKKVNKNEISKTYLQAKKQCKEVLDELTKNYKRGCFKPLQVCGDDVISTDYPDQVINIQVDERGNEL